MGVKTWFSRGEHQPLLEDTNMPRPTMIIRDPEQEARVQEWITAVIGEWPENQEYADALKNGVSLCKFMNTICPGSIKKINTQGAGFKLMENIAVLQTAMLEYGLDKAVGRHPEWTGARLKGQAGAQQSVYFNQN